MQTENKMGVALDIDLRSPFWSAMQDQQSWTVFFTHILSTMKTCISFSCDDPTISISLVDDHTMQSLNKQYRHKDKPTNVLAFPAEDSFIKKICLGDIVLSFETIQNEALEQNKPFMDHIAHMFVHGVLHLLGFDHIEDEDRRMMESKEIEILEHLGVHNPYVS